MPLTVDDVTDTLRDPVTAGMDFRLGPIHISGQNFNLVREHILAGNILVVSGTQGLAFYNKGTDILTTQAGNSPANLENRAQLLHECTHALVDVFANGMKVTRHMDELASYIVQHVYIMRSNPTWVVGPNNPPWYAFYQAVFALVKAFRLDTIAGNGANIGELTLEPLRVQLASLPGVNYGSFGKDDPAGADGLAQDHPFLSAREPTTARSASSAHESWPDPTDDYLIGRLQEGYAASDVAGYGGRLRALRKDFALCSLARAIALRSRLATRLRGDRVSELFHDRLSTGGRAILLTVLRNRK